MQVTNVDQHVTKRSGTIICGVMLPLMRKNQGTFECFSISSGFVMNSSMVRECNFPRRFMEKAPGKGNVRPENTYVGKKEPREGFRVLEELE